MLNPSEYFARIIFKCVDGAGTSDDRLIRAIVTRAEEDMKLVTKSKKLTNMRASGADDKVKIVPPIVFSLEEALEYIKADEYVEITPNHIRMRKIVLDELERKRIAKANGQDDD